MASNPTQTLHEMVSSAGIDLELSLEQLVEAPYLGDARSELAKRAAESQETSSGRHDDAYRRLVSELGEIETWKVLAHQEHLSAVRRLLDLGLLPASREILPILAAAPSARALQVLEYANRLFDRQQQPWSYGRGEPSYMLTHEELLEAVCTHVSSARERWHAAWELSRSIGDEASSEVTSRGIEILREALNEGATVSELARFGEYGNGNLCSDERGHELIQHDDLAEAIMGVSGAPTFRNTDGVASRTAILVASYDTARLRLERDLRNVAGESSPWWIGSRMLDEARQDLTWSLGLSRLGRQIVSEHVSAESHAGELALLRSWEVGTEYLLGKIATKPRPEVVRALLANSTLSAEDVYRAGPQLPAELQVLLAETPGIPALLVGDLRKGYNSSAGAAVLAQLATLAGGERAEMGRRLLAEAHKAADAPVGPLGDPGESLVSAVGRYRTRWLEALKRSR